MLYPLVPMPLHGWLDDLVALSYLAGAWLLGLRGTALGLALAGAATHFLLTRFTDYPQGTWRRIPFRLHAYIELGEGLGLIAATLALVPGPLAARAFLLLMGASQLVAFAFSDYGARGANSGP